MKIILFTLLLTMLYTDSSFGQSHMFEWATSIGGSKGTEVNHCSATDLSGNIYTAGLFAGETDFDPGAGFYNIIAKNVDGYISKLDANGNFKWVKTIPSLSQTVVTSIVTDSLGYIYVSGNYSDTILFEIGSIKQYDFSVRDNIFYAKLDSNGNFIWAKSLNDKSSTSSSPTTKRSKLNLDHDGNIIITGVFENRPDFNVGIDSFYLRASGYYGETFVLKTNKNGEFIWVKNFTASKLWNECLSFSVDSKNNIFLTGFFDDSMICYTSTSTELLVSNGDDDMYLTKLDSSGNCIWAKKFGDYDRDKGKAVIIDDRDNILMAADFSDTLSITVDTGIIKIPSTRWDNGILIKFDNDGRFKWYKRFQGYFSSSKLISIAQDKDENIYLLGEYSGNTDFDPGLDSFILRPDIYEAIFLTKFDSSGSFIYVKSFEPYNDLYYTPNFSLDTVYDAVYISGIYAEKFDTNPSLDSFIFNTYDKYDYDAFTIKLSSCYPSFGTDSAENCGSFTLLGEEITTSGVYKRALINSNGCDSILTLHLNILPKPIASITHVSIDTLQCYTSGVKYQWVNCPSYSPLVNDTNRILIAPYKGYFAVIVSNGVCSDTSDCRYLSPLSIEYISPTSSNIILYPNPFTQTATLEFDNPQAKAHHLSIFNTLGQSVFNIENIKNNKILIDRNGLQSGMYYYRLSNIDGIVSSGKMLIE